MPARMRTLLLLLLLLISGRAEASSLSHQVLDPLLSRTGARFFTSKIALYTRSASDSNYAYCGNNPVNGVDPSGLDAMFWDSGSSGRADALLFLQRQIHGQFNLSIAENEAGIINVSAISEYTGSDPAVRNLYDLLKSGSTTRFVVGNGDPADVGGYQDPSDPRYAHHYTFGNGDQFHYLDIADLLSAESFDITLGIRLFGHETNEARVGQTSPGSPLPFDDAHTRACTFESSLCSMDNLIRVNPLAAGSPQYINIATGKRQFLNITSVNGVSRFRWSSSP